MCDGEPGPSNPKKLRKDLKQGYSGALPSEELERLLYDSDDDIQDPDYSQESDEISYFEENIPRDILEESDEEEDVGSGNSQVQKTAQVVLRPKKITLPEDDPVKWEIDHPGFTQLDFLRRNEFLTLPQGNQPIDFFNLLVDDNFYDLIVNETNRYAVGLLLSEGITEHSRITNWHDVTAEELRVFFGLLFHMGTININRIQDYWKTNRFFNLPFFSSNMSRDRFMIIMRCLHFNKNPEETERKPDDILFKIRPVVDYFNNKMLETYYPGKNLSLDESMILWRGRLSFRQYIKNKAHKYGIKLYMLTEPDETVLKFSIYTGSLDDFGGKGHAANVVLHLMEEKLDVGHSIFMDNYYNSYDLAAKLLERNTFCTGTLRIDRKNNPEDVKKRKLKIGETIARYSKGIMIGKWRDKREVHYISTEFSNDMIVYQNKRGVEKEKPEAIFKYNQYMGGVDRQDQLLSYYPCERKTLLWYKKIGIHVLQLLLFNSYSLFRKHTKSNMSFYDFRMHVIEMLVPPKPNIRANQLVPQHVPVKNSALESGRIPCRRCQVCSKNKIRRETAYYCGACINKPALCVAPCFGDYHNNI